MTIQRLSLHHFRNLAKVDFQPAPGVNLIFGRNGSGKTSLLEAIHLLSLVRSFRSKKLNHLITHDQTSFTVFAQLQDEQDQTFPLAIQRQQSSDTTEVLLRGYRPASLAELTAELPIQLINPDAFRLLEGGPRERRQFLDWGTFHVEPSFIHSWQRFQRALKQRNSLLRHARMDALQLSLWEAEIAVTGEHITEMRKEYLKALTPIFSGLVEQLTGTTNYKLQFMRGWDKSLPLKELLEAGRNKDRDQGFTQSGPQRADLRVTIDKRAAVEVLSRGQQKLLVSALKLAQGELLAQQGRRRCIYLIDDLPAELDQQHRTLFCRVLEAQASQVFITSVEPEALDVAWKDAEKIARFHVEHGQLTSMNTNAVEQD